MIPASSTIGKPTEYWSRWYSSIPVTQKQPRTSQSVTSSQNRISGLFLSFTL